MTRTLLVAQAEAKVQLAPELRAVGADWVQTPGGSAAPVDLLLTVTAAGLWADDVQGGTQTVALAIPVLDAPALIARLTAQLDTLAAEGRITLGADAGHLLGRDA